MDYLRGYRTFRNDPEWSSKMFVGVALALCSGFIPILPQVALQGWAAMVVRRQAQGIESPLPRLDFDFDYLGKLLNPGFKTFIVSLLWTLPMTFLMVGMGMCLYFGGVMLVIGGAQTGDETGGVLALVCVGAAFLLMFPIAILMMMPATIATMRAELTDDLNEGMKFGEIMAMTKLVFKELFIGSLLIGTIQACLLFLGMLLCYFPAFFVMWLGIYVHATFQADLYKTYLAKGGVPLAKLAPTELPLPTPPQIPRPPMPPQQLPPQTQAGGW
jgi:hypothetical protein